MNLVTKMASKQQMTPAGGRGRQHQQLQHRAPLISARDRLASNGNQRTQLTTGLNFSARNHEKAACPMRQVNANDAAAVGLQQQQHQTSRSTNVTNQQLPVVRGCVRRSLPVVSRRNSDTTTIRNDSSNNNNNNNINNHAVEMESKSYQD